MQTQRRPFRKDALDRTGILNEVWVSGIFREKPEVYPWGFVPSCISMSPRQRRRSRWLWVVWHTWTMQMIPIQHSRAQGVFGQGSQELGVILGISCAGPGAELSNPEWIPSNLGCSRIPCCCWRTCPDIPPSQMPLPSEHLSSPEMCLQLRASTRRGLSWGQLLAAKGAN